MHGRSREANLHENAAFSPSPTLWPTCRSSRAGGAQGFDLMASSSKHRRSGLRLGLQDDTTFGMSKSPRFAKSISREPVRKRVGQGRWQMFNGYPLSPDALDQFRRDQPPSQPGHSEFVQLVIKGSISNALQWPPPLVCNARKNKNSMWPDGRSGSLALNRRHECNLLNL
jgi:hypothetical protein